MIPDPVRALLARQDRLQGAVRELLDILVARVAARRTVASERADLRALLAKRAVPHLRAERDVLIMAAAAVPSLSALARGLDRDLEALLGLVDEVTDSATTFDTLSATSAFLAMLEVHAEKSRDILLPGLLDVGADPMALAQAFKTALVARSKEAADMTAPQSTPEADASTADDQLAAQGSEQVVDTRIDSGSSCAMLATNAFDGLTVGGSFLLVADHDPRGINYMLRAERPGTAAWEVLEDGPARWQVRIGKIAAVA